MFGRSTPPDISTPKEQKPSLSVQGIPEEFYGGANPEIHFKKTTREIDMSTIGVPVADQKVHEQQTAVGGTNPSHPIHFFSDTKKIVVTTLVLLLVIIVGAGGYYLVTSKKNVTVVVNKPATSSPVVADFHTSPEVPAALPVSETVPTAVLAKLTMPSLLLSDSLDTDQDLLTDQEEALYRSDSGVTDSDNDSYPDAHEMYYLYSPIEKEPSRLINSGSVIEYTNPTFGYRLFYPASWVVGPVDAEHRDVLFSSVGGEYVEVRVFDRPSTGSFSDWLATVAPSERISDLARFTTRSLGDGVMRQDYVVYYFETADKIIVLAYHEVAGQTEISYRSTITMMARSLVGGSAFEKIDLPGIKPELGERKKIFLAPAVAPELSPVSSTITTSIVTTSTEVSSTTKAASDTVHSPSSTTSESTSSSLIQ
jgi:hypothetical protein